MDKINNAPGNKRFGEPQRLKMCSLNITTFFHLGNVCGTFPISRIEEISN